MSEASKEARFKAGHTGRPKGSKNKPKYMKAFNFAQRKALEILEAKVLDPEGENGAKTDRFSVIWARILKSDSDAVILQGVKFLTLCAFGKPPDPKKPEPVETPEAVPAAPLTEAEWLEKHGTPDSES